MRHRKIFDISVTLGEEAIDYPGDPAYERHVASSLERGDAFELSRLSLSAHCGTHLDAPSHFLRGGKSIDQFLPGTFILPAHVREVRHPKSVQRSALEDLRVDSGAALLLKTENSTSGRCRSGVYTEDYVHLNPEVADICVEKKLALVGLDYITVEKPGDIYFPVHRRLLGSGILILEGLDLTQVGEGQYTLICLPLKIRGGEASPVRAILVEE